MAAQATCIAMKMRASLIVLAATPTDGIDNCIVPSATNIAETERLAYSVQEAADLLGVDYFSVYRLIQRGKLRACRALRGKLLVPRSELLRLLNN